MYKHCLGTYIFSTLLYHKVLNVQQKNDTRIKATTVGQVLLKSRGFFTEDHWFWISVAALFGFSILFNILFIVALTYLNRRLPY